MTTVVIGVDPAKRSHAVEVIDERERTLAAAQFVNDNDGYRQMRALGRRWPQRVWAVEGAGGVGRQLALDSKLQAINKRIAEAVAATGTTLTEIVGVGPVTAAAILGEVGNIARFPDNDHFASYTGTAPIEVSSGEIVRHRLSRAGNRRMNYALHVIAMAQKRYDHQHGGAYYARKLAAG